MMSASPIETPVTNPVPLTLATDTFDDDHVACAVATCVAPFEKVAVAENCAVAPTFGALPPTASDETVAAGSAAVDAPPHAVSIVTTPATSVAIAITFTGFT